MKELLLNSQLFFKHYITREKFIQVLHMHQNLLLVFHVAIAPQERILSYNSVLPANVDARKSSANSTFPQFPEIAQEEPPIFE